MGRMSTLITAISQISSLVITLWVVFLHDGLGENFSVIIILCFISVGWILSLNKGLKFNRY